MEDIKGTDTRDAVCGMIIDKDTASKKETWNGKVYYFCSNSCDARFKNNPAKYQTES